jgi:hypothetical protein
MSLFYLEGKRSDIQSVALTPSGCPLCVMGMLSALTPMWMAADVMPDYTDSQRSPHHSVDWRLVMEFGLSRVSMSFAKSVSLSTRKRVGG